LFVKIKIQWIVYFRHGRHNKLYAKPPGLTPFKAVKEACRIP